MTSPAAPTSRSPTPAKAGLDDADPAARTAAAPSETGTPAVLLERVTRVFGATPALVRADLLVDRGESIVLRGANGAGKSTLLRIVATLISPTYGTGRVLGFDLAGERDEIRARTEFLGHRTRLYEDLTAAENLRFSCRLFRMPAAGVADALEAVDLGAQANDRVRTLSQGTRQRVAVARAMLRRPELLLLDEPYAGLDTAARDAVDGLIHETVARGGTAIVATHDPGRAAFATRTLFMQDGRLLPEAVGR